MDITESKRDLHVIIEQIPDDSLEEARHLLKEFLGSREKSAPKKGATPEERLLWMRSLPEEDYDMTEEEKRSMASGEEDMKAGRVHKFEDVAAELGM
jgi:hypothetical protein